VHYRAEDLGPDGPARRLVLTPAPAIKPEPVVWAWEDNGHGRIPGRIGGPVRRAGRHRQVLVPDLEGRPGDAGQVRQALDPLARIADQTSAVVAGIAHFNKSSGTDASSLITASGAFKDVARFIFAFATDPQDGTQNITQTKNSLGISDLPSLACHITEAVVPSPAGDARVGQFVLDGEADRTVRDILGTREGGEGQDEKTRAENYLREALAEGPRRTTEAEEEAPGSPRHQAADLQTSPVITTDLDRQAR
jgi:hypothetical protein